MLATRPSTQADLLRSCWLVPATSVGLCQLPLACIWIFNRGSAQSPSLQGAIGTCLFVYAGIAPFVAILTHFKLHRPRDSRVLLAFFTGLVSTALAYFMFIAAMFMSTPTL